MARATKEPTMDFTTSMAVSASGLKAQSERMKIISENIANANSTATTPGGDPYRRQIPTMKSAFDRTLNATMVQTDKPVTDNSDFRLQYDPGNPIADAQGYVKLPNVNSLIEIMDMRDAQRAYEADLTVMDATKTMLSRTVDLLRK
jgi:flagellar basal-body rod protein FlgC